MTVVDLFVVGLVAAGAGAGWRMGFLQRLLSWLLMVVCLTIAAVVISFGLSTLDDTASYWLVLGVLVALIAAAVLGHTVGTDLARRLRPGPTGPAGGSVDRGFGAALGALGVLSVVWLVTPAVLSLPGWLAAQTADAATIRAISAVTPEPPEQFGSLDALTGDTAFNPIVNNQAPAVEVGPPPSVETLDAVLEAAISRSVLQIESIACSQRQDGTGFVIGDGLVMTNAHVVAGSLNISVQSAARNAESAEIVAFDPERDLAVLRISPGTEPALVFAEGVPGSQATALGYPGGGELRSQPVVLTERVRATGRDLYDERDISRRVYFMAADLGLGESGAPVVDDAGAVVAVVFAVAPDDEAVAFAVTAEEAENFLADADLATPEPPSDCLN